jgi:YVTN family beta-propeller protein
MRALPLLLVLACHTPEPEPPLPCRPEAPDAMLRTPGRQQDGSFLTLDGRRADPAGVHLDLPGYLIDVLPHPTLPIAYVTSASSDDRRLLVVDVDRMEVLQDLNRGRAYQGLWLSPDGQTLLASGGAAERIDRYTVGDDGLLTQQDAWTVDGYVSGIIGGTEADSVWVSLQQQRALVELDATTGAVRRTVPLTIAPYRLVADPSRGQAWVSGLADDDIERVDLATGEALPLTLGGAPGALVMAPDGATIWAVTTKGDTLVAIDPASMTVTATVDVAADALDPGGRPRANSNPNHVAFHNGRLYVTRGADNAISVFDAQTLARIGDIPTGFYPTASTVMADDATLFVVEGKGSGAGPSEGRSAKTALDGGASRIDLATLDVAAATAEVVTNFQRPIDLFAPTCATDFPIPTSPEIGTPIEHVVLIVKENKTFDCLFGDYPGANGDPELLRYGADVTPNLRALAGAFTLSDNFYTQVQESDNGHLFLTQGHLPEYAERIFLEQSQTEAFFSFTVQPQSVPRLGTLFTHLLDEGRTIRIFGEIVGMFVDAADGTSPADFSDAGYPGGPFYNSGVPDIDKAERVVEVLTEEGLPDLTYILYPNDHTVGTSPGAPTPESMIADNDAAIGRTIDAISHMPEWPKTVIFIVQDDPQGCEDSVDAHRSPLMVVSPWVRRGYISHVHHSFLSVFASITRILGVEPLGRSDAAAAALWDFFQDTPDLTPYTALARTWPEEVNDGSSIGAEASAAMDFRGPDRAPGLTSLLDAYRLARMGRIPRTEALRRVAAIATEEEDEAEERAEATAFAADVRRYLAWAAGRGLDTTRAEALLRSLHEDAEAEDEEEEEHIR